MWFLYSLISAFTQAINQALSKKFQTKNNYLILASFSYLLNAFLLFTASFFKGFPLIGPNFLKAVAICAVLNVIGAICFFASLRLTDLSLATPMLALTPVFLTLNSYIILGERPSLIGFIGILSVVLGVFFINIPKNSNKFLHAFHSIKNNKGILLMLFVALVWSFSIPYDKMATLSSDFLFAPAWTALFCGIFFTIYAVLKFKNTVPRLYKNALKGSLLIGLASFIGTAFTNLSYYYALTAYVISVKRLSVLFGVLLGIYLFKEQESKKRIIGAIIAIAGVVLIVFA
jgi:drug/metabolite transporter (DMT)-like permease